MQFQSSLTIEPLKNPVRYTDKILITGSCFSEHIGKMFIEAKFNIKQNPNGILFDPISICQSIKSYVTNQKYDINDLFYLNELWHSWHHHSSFSTMESEICLQQINQSQQEAHLFLKDANWLIITLGSSYCYQLITQSNEKFIANCHRAPANWFKKKLLEISEIYTALNEMITAVLAFNSKIKIIFTISPVRHIRDGLIENNRSKARLIEAVQTIVTHFENCCTYFPAYELVIDVLRDYRFYDIDLVHPNYMATNFVMEKFTEANILKTDVKIMEEVKKNFNCI